MKITQIDLPKEKKKASQVEAIDFSDMQELLEYIIPEYQGSGSVYHYTTIEALVNGIIPKNKKEKLIMWATHSNYMNDPKEFRVEFDNFIKDTENIQIMQDVFKDVNIDDVLSKVDVFLLSFSANKDYLPMWSMYGRNGNGVILEFDKKNLMSTSNSVIRCLYPRSKEYYKIIELLRKIFTENDDYKFSKGRFFLALDKVRHKKSTFDERKLRLRDKCNCDSCIKDFASMMALILLPIIAHKHRAYEYEKEFRSIILADNLDSIKYRYRDGMLVPYIERKINRSALKSIIIGPTQDFERSKKSLDMFLKSRGFNNIPIIKSNVPYR